MNPYIEKFFEFGRKFAGASFASVLLFIAFVFVAITEKGVAAFPEFVMGVVALYTAFAGGNAAATFATRGGTKVQLQPEKKDE